MPQPCTVCISPHREEINRALVSGEPNRRIASRCDVSEIAVRRHKTEHLPATMVKAREVEDVGHAIDVVQQLKAINSATLQVLSDARKVGDGDLALKAVDRVQRQIELQAKLLGELDERPQVNVLVAPEWLVVRATLLDALQGFPEARTAVAARLLALEASA